MCLVTSVKNVFYYINTNEIPGELSRENWISSHVKISPLLWLHDKSRLWHQKTIKLEWFGISLVLKKYFTRSLRSLVTYFSTLEEKFRISARPCNILYAILQSFSGDKQPTYHKSSYFMQWAAAWALVKTLQASPARLKGVSSPNEPRHLSCSLHQQQNPFIDNKKIGNDYWKVNGLNPMGEALPIATFPGPGGYARKGRDLTSWSTGGGVGAGGSTASPLPPPRPNKNCNKSTMETPDTVMVACTNDQCQRHKFE